MAANLVKKAASALHADDEPAAVALVERALRITIDARMEDAAAAQRVT